MVKGEDERRGTWEIGGMNEVFVRKHRRLIRCVQITKNKWFLEQPVQLLTPLALY